jgi:hypothetical protein
MSNIHKQYTATRNAGLLVDHQALNGRDLYVPFLSQAVQFIPDGAEHIIEIQGKRHSHLIRQRLIENGLMHLGLPHENG